MPEYANTIIYKIVCNDLNITDCYIGHTTNFTKRKQNHKHSCIQITDKHYNYKIYTSIRANGGWINWSMIEIEKYPCLDANEARAREHHWYEIFHAKLNSRPPIGLSKAEHKKQYNIKHKEEIAEYEKHRYSIQHKCECGGCYKINHKQAHLRTKKHINYIATTELVLTA